MATTVVVGIELTTSSGGGTEAGGRVTVGRLVRGSEGRGTRTAVFAGPGGDVACVLVVTLSGSAAGVEMSGTVKDGPRLPVESAVLDSWPGDENASSPAIEPISTTAPTSTFRRPIASIVRQDRDNPFATRRTRQRPLPSWKGPLRLKG